MNNTIRRRWIIDEIITKLKRNLFFFDILSKAYKYFSFISNYFTIRENKIFELKHKGETCYILGNGISIENLDIETINHNIIFACNEIFYHNQFDQLNISYYTVMEPYYGQLMSKKYKQDTLNLYEDINQSFKNKNTVCFFHPSIKKLLKKNRFLENKLIYYIASLSTKKPIQEQSYNLAGNFNFGQGALSFMIAASVYMGFKKIVLLGCGYTFEPRQEYHFYARPSYSKSKYNYNSMLKKAEEDAKKAGLFIFEISETEDNYLPVFTRTIANDQTAMRYRQLNELVTSKNIEIINIHPSKYKSLIIKGQTWDQYKISAKH